MAIQVAINGAAGRMGRCLIQAVSETDGLQLSAAIDRADSSLIGVDAGELAGVGKLGVEISHDVAAATALSDVIIDFTLPEVTLALLPYCAQNKCRPIIGTTGFDAAQKTNH